MNDFLDFADGSIVTDPPSVNPLRIACPVCHAPVAMRCRDAGGDAAIDQHAARIMASQTLDKGAERDHRPPRPCCHRMRSLSGSSHWCCLPANHEGEHHGLCSVEAERVVGEYRKGMR